MQIPSQTTQAIVIESSPVIASIFGGSRGTALTGSTVAFDASASYDPDSCTYSQDSAYGESVCSPISGGANSVLAFVWACSINAMACLFKAGTSNAFILSTGPTAALDLTSLVLASEARGESPTPQEILVTVSVSRFGGTSTSLAQASVVVTVTETPILDVQIRPLYITAQRCAYSAVSAAGALGVVKYVWALVPTGSGARGFKSDDTATFLAGNTGAEFVVDLGSPVAAALFSAPGASYAVFLAAEDSTPGMQGKAYLDLTPHAPPSGGWCTAAPTNGTALVTPLVISCIDWTSDSLPLAYSFSSRPASVGDPRDPSISWSAPTPASSYELFLSAGNYSLASSISDSVGAVSVAVAAGRVLVLTAGSDTASKAEVNMVGLSLLSDRLVGRGQIGGAVIMLDGVSASLNAATPSTSAICTSSGGCRRLLSSRAYRTALRRLLLGKLGPLASKITARLGDPRAPAILRAARRTAAMPTELDRDVAASSISTLDAASAALDINALRKPGALSDAVLLAARSLSTTESTSEENKLSDAVEQALDSLLRIGNTYGHGMVAGENPVELQAAGTADADSVLRLSIASGRSCPGVTVYWADSPPALPGSSGGSQERRSVSGTGGSDPARGLAVARLGTALGQPTGNGPDGMAASAQVRPPDVSRSTCR